jgi:Concanavalin A-like lectin/glucanases superfamily
MLALCGLAAAAGVTGASAAVTGSSAGPVAAYGFDEGRGVRVADASDNANNGTTTARRTEAGRFGRALRMDGRSEAAIVPDRASLRLPKTVTLEAWVYPDRANGSRAIVVKEGGRRVAYALSTTGGRPQAVINSGSTMHVARAASPLKPGRWTHLTTTYDGRSVRLFVGGVQVARTPASGRMLTARGPLRIGGGGTGGNRFIGRIDEVRVYGRVLKHAEILRDMNRAVRSDPSGGSTTPVIVKRAPTTAIPVSPAPGDGSPRSGGGTLQWGYVANSGFAGALSAAQDGHGKLIRMEFEIGDNPASMAPDVAAAADKGIEVLLLAGFDSRIPSVSEAQNLGAWARTFGPGGSFWATRSDKALASRFIEFGNETSYSYQGTNDRGGEYALRFKDAYNAIQAANPRLGLLAQADDGNCGCANWVNAMAGAVPNLGTMVAGWTVHPYGPVSRWKPRVDRLISQTAAKGWSSAIPIDITEYGIATDNGANLGDNYDWPANQTYQQAGDAVTLTVDQMLAYAPLASRLRLFTYFQGHDQQASGTGQREHYFGVMKNDGSPKGGLTTAVQAIADAHPAH